MKKILKIASLAALVAASPQAMAAEFFVGLNVGTSSFSGLEEACDDLIEDNRLIGGFPIGCAITDDSDSTLNINAGVNFNRFIGLEAGYVDLGEYGADFTVTRVTVSAEAEADYAYASLVLTAPFSDQFSVSARFGGVNANAEVTSAAAGVGIEFEDETTGFVGASIDYRFNDHFSLQLRYDDLDAVDVTSAGIRYTF